MQLPLWSISVATLLGSVFLVLASENTIKEISFDYAVGYNLVVLFCIGCCYGYANFIKKGDITWGSKAE